MTKRGYAAFTVVVNLDQVADWDEAFKRAQLIRPALKAAVEAAVKGASVVLDVVDVVEKKP